MYLADYGLSYRYCPNGEHKEYKENPKKGHNGTIEYTSIDAHKGVGNVKSVIYFIFFSDISQGEKCMLLNTNVLLFSVKVNMNWCLQPILLLEFEVFASEMGHSMINKM